MAALPPIPGIQQTFSTLTTQYKNRIISPNKETQQRTVAMYQLVQKWYANFMKIPNPHLPPPSRKPEKNLYAVVLHAMVPWKRGYCAIMRRLIVVNFVALLVLNTLQGIAGKSIYRGPKFITCLLSAWSKLNVSFICYHQPHLDQALSLQQTTKPAQQEQNQVEN